jgi:hypothetical protein
MSKSGEIAGTAFKKAFAIAVMAISYLVDRINNVGSRPPDDFAPSKNGFGCVSKWFHGNFGESKSNRSRCLNVCLIRLRQMAHAEMMIGYGWLQVKCHRCETEASIPLDAIRRLRDTPIWKLEAALKCRSCRTPRYSPAFT